MPKTKTSFQSNRITHGILIFFEGKCVRKALTTIEIISQKIFKHHRKYREHSIFVEFYIYSNERLNLAVIQYRSQFVIVLVIANCCRYSQKIFLKSFYPSLIIDNALVSV